MNNLQVAHVWAGQNRESASGSNLWFEGRVIYSYGRHYPIAAFTDREHEGQRVVLFNSEGSSMTTESKHKPKVREALNGLNVLVLRVPRVLEGSSQHSENLQHFETLFTSLILKASRAKSHGPRYIEEAEVVQRNAETYCRVFGLGEPAFINAYIDPALIEDAHKRAKAASLDEARKTRERNEARRVAQEAQRVAQRVAQEARAVECAEEVAQWLAGSRHSAPYDYAGDTLLRLSADGHTVQTSRGASVPVEDARKLWRMVARCRVRGEAVHTPPPVMVGDFSLRHITREGDVQIGCHLLTFAVCASFASAQGWNGYGAFAVGGDA